MVNKNQQVQSKIRTFYYLEPGQKLSSTKISERKLMLIAPRSEYKRLVDYTNQSERMTVVAEKERAKLAAIRKATYEMSKHWNNTNENVKRRRRAELLAKRKQEDEIRARFAKEIAEQNASEREKVVEEARRLLLYKKPLCRLLNGALLTSECFRERDAQLAFEKTLRGVDEEQEKEYAKILKQEAEDFEEAERRKAAEREKKNRAYGEELKKQIDDDRNNLKRADREEYLMGRQDLINMAREIREIKECEDEQKLNRKNELKKLVTDAIREKEKFEIESKREKEFCDRAIEIFERSKRRIAQIRKIKAQEELQAKMRHAEYLGELCSERKKFAAATSKKRLDNEDELTRQAREEIEAKELAMIEAKKQRALELKMECIKLGEEAANEKRRRDYETKELNNWETLQRLKRDEFNKEFEINERKREWEQKMTNARDLRQQMSENEEKRNREKRYENDENSAVAIIEKTNKKVLEYGQQILNESKGVRPLYPILKTIEKFKIENGLVPRKTCDENNVLAPARKPRKRTPVCSAPVPEHEVVYI
ncbi:cilia- and flagella- associated protein 210 [Neodiprion pinetum]|uniref:cilia- and flagella- associated protein 210 n=1 Tax=Neodiprion pinetum TaxID=441929 RepID=UPI001EDF98CB|nr:trichohyalin-like [Neodiprion pinetum]